MAERERRLSLPGRIEQVRAACEFVVEAARAAGLGEEGIFQSQLAVDEIFTNIIEHGYKHDGAGKQIEVITEITDEALIISILDEAPHFNPLTLDTPNREATLWEREEGGWGIHFVRQFMDDVKYVLDGNRNRLILEKRISDGSG